MKLKNRKAELVHQRVKVCSRYSYNIKFIFTDTKPYIFRIPKNRNILNTPSKSVSFSFSIEGLSNLNCLQGKVRKSL